jgi:hypothetical protein
LKVSLIFGNSWIRVTKYLVLLQYYRYHKTRCGATKGNRVWRNIVREGCTSEVEKTVLDLATAMTLNPGSMPDDVFSRLQDCFDPVQIIEITAAIALENYRSRFNHALGIESHGFSEGSYFVRPEERQMQSA